jgi:hypothetical protein
MASQLHLETYVPPLLTVFLLLTTVTTLALLYNLLYNRFTKENSSLPLFIPDEGSQKKRWLYDSENLLREGYREVRLTDTKQF